MIDVRHEKRRIENDLFGIADALRAVDGGYFIQLDKLRGRFEVHNIRQYGDTYCLTLPFERLDRRAVEYVRRTRSERGEKLLAELERVNERLEREAAYGIRQRALAKIKI